MADRQCVVCGTPVQQRSGRGRPAKYCSESCAHTANLKKAKANSKTKRKVRALTTCTCLECNAAFERYETRGPKPKYCSYECRLKAGNRRTKERRKNTVRCCKRCGTEIKAPRKTCDACRITRSCYVNECRFCREQFTVETPRQRFCGHGCAQRHNLAKQITKNIRCCEHCRTIFDAGPPSGQDCAHGRFCSASCYHENRTGGSVLRKSRTRLLRILSSYKPCETCGDTFVSTQGHKTCSLTCAQKRQALLEWRKLLLPSIGVEITCRECGVWFTPIYATNKRRFCTTECGQRHSHRISKKRRRARSRGVKNESVDPLKVFERDNWRCQLCGYNTHKARRGTWHYKAPELDHIMPLAHGGEHTYRNTQCSCRSCNQKKSDGIGGQLRLIG